MISLVHKVIFIHIPKCAGQSVEETFLNDLKLSWDDHRYLFGCFERPSSWNKNIPDRLALLTAKEILELNLLPEEIFNFIKSLQKDSLVNYLPAKRGVTDVGKSIELGFSCYALKIYYMTSNWDTLDTEKKDEWHDFLWAEFLLKNI